PSAAKARSVHSQESAPTESIGPSYDTTQTRASPSVGSEYPRPSVNEASPFHSRYVMSFESTWVHTSLPCNVASGAARAIACSRVSTRDTVGEELHMVRATITTTRLSSNRMMRLSTGRRQLRIRRRVGVLTTISSRVSVAAPVGGNSSLIATVVLPLIAVTRSAHSRNRQSCAQAFVCAVAPIARRNARRIVSQDRFG